MNESIVPILRAADALQSAAWYERLGFQVDFVHRFEPHLPAFVAISRGLMRIFLSEHDGDAQPHALIYLYVTNVWDMAAALGVEVRQEEWGDEFQIHDPDNNRLRINTPRIEDDSNSGSDDDRPDVEIDKAVERDAVEVLVRLGFEEVRARAAVEKARVEGPHFRSPADLVKAVLSTIPPITGPTA